MKKTVITVIMGVFASAFLVAPAAAQMRISSSFEGQNSMVSTLIIPTEAGGLRLGAGLTIPEDSDNDISYNARLGFAARALKGVVLDLVFEKNNVSGSDVKIDAYLSYAFSHSITDSISLGFQLKILDIRLDETEDLKFFRGVTPLIVGTLPF